MSTDTVVVGAGIVGICCALSLTEKGVNVTLVDRDEPGQGASYGNAGVIAPWSNVPQCIPGVGRNLPGWLLNPNGPLAVRWGYMFKALPWAVRFLANATTEKATATSDAMAALNAPNIDIYRHHLNGTGQEDLIRDSMLIQLFRDRSKADLNGIGWRLRARHNTPVDLIDGNELRELEPALSSDYQAAILIKDQARTILPGQLGKALADRFRSMGGQLRKAAVHRLMPLEAGGWRVETDTDDIEANKLVLAAGAWSARLLEPLGVKLPLEAERGYHLTFKNPGVTLNNSVLDTNLLFITSSMTNGIRSAGTSELAGLDAPPNYRRARILADLTKSMIPDLNTSEAEAWMGTRPTLPDNLPCIGEVPGLPGLFAAFGHSHWGMSMAPQTGRIIADLVAGSHANIDLTPYRIDRFS